MGDEDDAQIRCSRLAIARAVAGAGRQHQDEEQAQGEQGG